MTIILDLLTSLLVGAIGLMTGFILGFLKGLQVERDEIEKVEEGLRDFSSISAKPKLQVSHSRREQNEMRNLDETFPVPDIRKTLEERSRGQE